MPSAGPALPDLSPPQQFALLARILAREGYSQGYHDALSGHMTYVQTDGTLLVNPLSIEWSQLQAGEVATIDRHGNQLAGPFEINPATTLHLAVHSARDDAKVTIHNHPRWATIWADHARVPPAYDQTSALFDGSITVVNEFEGTVEDRDIADRVVAAMLDHPIALLAHHGVLVIGHSVENALTRALALEARCRLAWHVEALGSGARELPEKVASSIGDQIAKRDGAYPGLWTALVTRELRFDATVLA